MTAAVALLVSCTGGEGTGERADRPVASSTSTDPLPSAGASSTTTSAPSSTTDPPGSVTLRVSGFTLPAETALRIGVRASAPRMTVRRRGVGVALSACPITDAGSPANLPACAALEASGTVELAAPRGVEIRATGAGATVEEVAVSYLPIDRSTTVVIPARPAGSCAVACEATFTLSPTQAGSFALQGRAGGGRPRLTLQARGGSPPGSRVLATVEGGAALSISAVLEPSAEAVLLYREQVEGAVGALTMEISWP